VTKRESRRNPPHDADPFSIALLIMGAIASIATIAAPIRVEYYERRRRIEAEAERRRRLSEAIWSIERTLIEIRGLVQQFESLVKELIRLSNYLDIEFSPGQVVIITPTSVEMELSRIKKEVYHATRRMDDYLGTIIALVGLDIAEKLSGMRKDFLEAYRRALFAKTYLDFTAALDSLIIQAQRIVDSVKEFYG